MEENNQAQPTENRQEQTDSTDSISGKKDQKEKGPIIAVSVIAVIALILAGVFFVSAKNSQKAKQSQADAVKNATNEISKKVSEASQAQSAKDAEKQAKEAEMQAKEVKYTKLVEEQQKLIDEANQKFQDDNVTQTKECETLLVTMPTSSVITYQSNNWNKDIVKFYSDLESAQKKTEKDSEEWNNFDMQKRVTEPYKQNFMAHCSDIYNADNSTIKTQTTSKESGETEVNKSTEK